ncbi:M protein repeat protein [Opisthorchis viverrini]|uniref:M protein repeat protein n=1 Tax=Opisthorchis viverrini TaxID=6198 RepID=A0A1S8X819_OPIVI|nr:M protein repeat protein [Opisthorchis viverrini]
MKIRKHQSSPADDEEASDKSFQGGLPNTQESLMISFDMLQEDRLHSIRHRQNYQDLKDAYQQLQASHSKLDSELALKIKEEQLTGQKHAREIGELQTKYQKLEKAYEEACRSQVTKERLEMVKLQVTQDVEQVYRSQIAEAHAGIAAARNENIRLREEADKATTELERERAEFQAIIEQNRVIYDAEISNLRKIKEDLNSRIKRLTADEISRSQDAGKENAQLAAKYELVSKELEEQKQLRKTEREKIQTENHTLRNTCSDLKAENQEVRAERDSLKNQLRLLRTEYNALRSEFEEERQRSATAVRSSTEAEQRLTNLTHKTRIELSNLRLEAQQQRAEIEKQRDDFILKCQTLERDLQLMGDRCQQVESSSAKRELEATERETAVREELGTEIIRLEAKVSQLTQQLRITQHALNSEETAQKSIKPKDDEESLRMRRELDELNGRLIQVQECNRRLAEKLENSIAKSVPTGKEDRQLNAMQLSIKDAENRQLRDTNQELQQQLASKKRTLQERIKQMKKETQLQQLELEKLRAENDLLRAKQGGFGKGDYPTREPLDATSPPFQVPITLGRSNTLTRGDLRESGGTIQQAAAFSTEQLITPTLSQT